MIGAITEDSLIRDAIATGKMRLLTGIEIAAERQRCRDRGEVFSMMNMHRRLWRRDYATKTEKIMAKYTYGVEATKGPASMALVPAETYDDAEKFVRKYLVDGYKSVRIVRLPDAVERGFPQLTDTMIRAGVDAYTDRCRIDASARDMIVRIWAAMAEAA